MSFSRAARRLAVPAATTLVLLAVLLGLGTWQAHRLAWKTDLLARIDAAEAGPPVPLTDRPEPFAKVQAIGRFDNAREALVGLEVRGTTLGARLLVPLLREGAPALLVDRGWVPLERDRPVGHPEGEVAVIGRQDFGQEDRHVVLQEGNDPLGEPSVLEHPAGEADGIDTVAKGLHLFDDHPGQAFMENRSPLSNG